MTAEQCMETVRALLAMFGEQAGPEDELVLDAMLDRLAAAVTAVDATFDERDWPDPPESDYMARRTTASRRFPHLGYYNIPGDVGGQPDDVTDVGDAIDDLADIMCPV